LVAGFRTSKRAVYVISDLTATENVTIAQKLSPAVRRHIEQGEWGTLKDELLKPTLREN
jgi:hypothetical protein